MENKSFKILAIDDNPDNLTVLEALIKDAFPDVVYLKAESGRMGFDLCKVEKPDVILLDIVMPGMDGYETCARIKSDVRLKNIPVVMVTANRADKASRIKALDVGADAFLPKPVDESELRAQLRAMLRIKEAEDLKKEEKQRLEDMVLERTEALENELADRIKAEDKLIKSLDKINRNRQAMMNLMEDLKSEMIDRKQIEENLQLERNLLRTLIDNIPFPIYVLDKEGRKVIANKADVENICFNSEAEVLGKTDLELFLGETGVRGHANNMDVIKTGKPNIDIEEKFINIYGMERWLLSSQYPLTDTSGDIKGLVGIGFDITERRKAAEKLRESEEKFRTLIENQGEGVGIVDREEKFVFANPAAEEMFGVEKGSLINHSLLEFMKPADKRVIELETKKRAKAEKSSYEIDLIRPDGEQRTLLITATPQFTKDGKLSGTFGVFRDITKRKQIELALRESEYFFKESQRAASVGSYKTDFISGFWESSEVLDKIFGIGIDFKKDLFGWIDLIHPDDKEMMNEYFTVEIFSQHKTFNKEYRIVRNSDKETRWVFGQGELSLDAQGAVISLIGTIQDITERKHIEEQLVKSEAYYRTLIDISPDGIIITDLEGNVSYGSFKAYEIFGIPLGEDVTGTSILRWLAQDSQGAIMDRVMEIMEGNIAPEIREYKLRKFDGSIFWGEISSSPLSDKDGNPSSLIIVCRDVTERKKAEIELIKSKEKAEESDRLKTAFLHNISHEIRTPMNAIVGFASMLSEPELDTASQKSFVDVITQSSNHLLEIVSDIIEISNIEAGLIKISLGEVRLNDMLNQLLEQFKFVASEKGIRFILEKRDGNSEVNIESDKTKLYQILSNLLSNSLKFTSKGEIHFGYEMKNNYIEFFVSDTGIGVPEAQHKRIFERFYQVENSLERQYEGTGLGLSISKAYVELLGGEIWMTSEPGKGSVFYFTILSSQPGKIGSQI